MSKDRRLLTNDEPSLRDYRNNLSRANRDKLDTLSSEFDALFARMQTPAARAGMKAAFDASPRRLGKAAMAVARIAAAST